jgi:hypothetical protein
VRLIRARTRRAGVLLVAVVALAALLLIALWPYFALVNRTPDLASQSFWPTVEPRPLELPGDLLGIYSPFAIPTVALALIAAGGVKAIVRRLRRGQAAHDRLWLHASLWTIVGVVMSLRERVAWGGRGPHAAAPGADAIVLPGDLRHP